jgi:hypothetical protein
MEASIVAGWLGAGCGLKFRRVGDDKVGNDFSTDRHNLWHNFRLMSRALWSTGKPFWIPAIRLGICNGVPIEKAHCRFLERAHSGDG